MSDTPVRLCGPDCWTPQEPHLEPEPDWIGDHPVMHGGSERPVPGTGGWNGLYDAYPDMYCLCGHPFYATCPGWYDGGGGLGGLTIRQPEGEK